MTAREYAIIAAIDTLLTAGKPPRIKAIANAVGLGQPLTAYYIRNLKRKKYVDYFGGANLTPKASAEMARRARG